MNDDILCDIMSFAKTISGIKVVDENMAVHQDIRIAGDDIADFADLIAAQYGNGVYQWPWERFAILDEGLSIFFGPMLIWQLISWPFRGSFGYPDELERLTLGHIAKVIDAGHWIDP